MEEIAKLKQKKQIQKKKKLKAIYLRCMQMYAESSPNMRKGWEGFQNMEEKLK